MKTERRHDLETNKLDDWLGVAIERVKPYTSAIVGGLVAAGLLVGAYIFFATQTERAEVAGWNLYFASLETARDTNDLTELSDLALSAEFEGTDVANWARITLADAHYRKGLNALFNDRGAANDELRKALDSYNYVAEYSGQPLFEQRGILGKAQVYESLNELDNAQKAYAQLRDQFPNGVYRAEAENRLRALEAPAVKEFYDWFAQQKPRPGDSILSPGRPGLRPDFDNVDALMPSSGGPSLGDTTFPIPDFGNPGPSGDEPPATSESPETSTEDNAPAEGAAEGASPAAGAPPEDGAPTNESSGESASSAEQGSP